MQQHFTRALKEWSIRPAEYSVLSLVGSNPLVTPADLSSALAIKRPNLVGVIERLERRGLIARTVYERDRRNHVLGLTARGGDVLAQLSQRLAQMERGVTRCWTRRERSQLVEMLQRFYQQG